VAEVEEFGSRAVDVNQFRRCLERGRLHLRVKNLRQARKGVRQWQGEQAVFMDGRI
jgi:hypothetical protein